GNGACSLIQPFQFLRVLNFASKRGNRVHVVVAPWTDKQPTVRRARPALGFFAAIFASFPRSILSKISSKKSTSESDTMKPLRRSLRMRARFRDSAALRG